MKGQFQSRSSVIRSLKHLAAIGMLVSSTIFLPACCKVATAAGGYEASSIAAIARSYNGQWGGNACRDAGKPQTGQCKQFVNCVVALASGGQQYPAPGYHDGFARVGGFEVSSAQAASGDIIQVNNNDSARPLHTAVILQNGGNNNFWVVDSNWVAEETVGEHSFNPYSWAPGADIRIWRLAGAGPPPGSGWAGVAGLEFSGKSSLESGEVLRPNQYLLSDNGWFVWTLQTDGNLVLYHNQRAIWSSQTTGLGGRQLTMQPDGNLVLYRDDGAAVWNTYSYGNLGAHFAIQDDGNAVVYRSDWSPLWNSQTRQTAEVFQPYGSDQLTNDTVLSARQYLRSTDRNYTLLLQADGNVVLYAAGYRVIWNSQTGGSGANHLVMQSDGNLVLYRSNGTPAWKSNTMDSGGTHLIVQTDGNLVLYRDDHVPVWDTGTMGRL